jgi:altronate hydrolase
MSAPARTAQSAPRRPLVLVLSPADNVAVAIAAIPAGTSVAVGAAVVVAREAIPLGHKIALEDIGAGGTVRKLGVPIGAATAAIPRGSHVHVHNLTSLYLTNDVDHYE